MAAPKFKQKRKFSPIGMLLHCHVNSPDMKYPGANGPKYKTKLVLDGRGAETGATFKADLEALLEEAWKAETEGMKPADLKKWSKAPLPMDEEVNDQDEPTGRLIFKFSQNSVIKQKDGEEKKISIAIVDSKGRPAGKLKVFSGTEARVGHSVRSYAKADTKQIGITLDFDIVKVIKPSSRMMDYGPEDAGWEVGDEANDFDGDNTSTNTAKSSLAGSDEGSGDF